MMTRTGLEGDGVDVPDGCTDGVFAPEDSAADVSRLAGRSPGRTDAVVEAVDGTMVSEKCVSLDVMQKRHMWGSCYSRKRML